MVNYLIERLPPAITGSSPAEIGEAVCNFVYDELSDLEEFNELISILQDDPEVIPETVVNALEQLVAALCEQGDLNRLIVERAIRNYRKVMGIVIPPSMPYEKYLVEIFEAVLANNQTRVDELTAMPDWWFSEEGAKMYNAACAERNRRLNPPVYREPPTEEQKAEWAHQDALEEQIRQIAEPLMHSIGWPYLCDCCVVLDSMRAYDHSKTMMPDNLRSLVLEYLPSDPANDSSHDETIRWICEQPY